MPRRRRQPRLAGAFEGDVVSEFSRVIGQRQTPLLGALRAPSTDERAWMARMAPAQTRVPKGVFRYTSLKQANTDWERWQTDAITAVAKP